MPHVKDHKNSKKHPHRHDDGETATGTQRAKRRPGREEPEASDADVRVVDVESSAEELHTAHTEAEKHEHHHESPEETLHEGHEDQGPKVEIRFFGSELLRAKFPQPFDVAEAVATDWVNGGSFEHLPIKQPLAQFAAQKGLQRAKELEKKVLESPVTEKVAMQALTMGMKAQGLISQIRSRLKKD